MLVELREIDSVKPYDQNPRLNDGAVAAVAKSIQQFGFRQPIVVDKDGVIVVGHTRWKAAKQLGLTQVPVHVAVELTPEQARAYRLADNQTATIAEWDLELLPIELAELKAVDFDIESLGFSPEQLEELLAPPPTPGLSDPDEVPEASGTPTTQLGDLWLLGEHRLLCGDSTSAAQAARLMDGQLAALVFTDPPYGVDYDGGTVVRQRLAGDATTALYGTACRISAEFSDEHAALYLWHAGTKTEAAVHALSAAGYQVRSQIIWNKNQAQFGALSAQYKQKHEPCFYAFRKGHSPRWHGPANEVSVWDCARARVNELHPTQKPVELAARAIRNNSSPGELVADWFSGSGSTLVACEMSGRRCRAMEIEPRYCDVAVERWEVFTGRKAQRVPAEGQSEKAPTSGGARGDLCGASERK